MVVPRAQRAGARAGTTSGTGPGIGAHLQGLSVGRPLVAKPAGPLRCPADPGVDHGSECVPAQNGVVEQLLQCNITRRSGRSLR
jgi:hypothetical protein